MGRLKEIMGNKKKKPNLDECKTVELTPSKRDNAVPVIDNKVLRVINVHNIGKRDSQQDSFAVSSLNDITENGLLAVVADGMGGLKGGAESSNLVANYFMSEFRAYHQQNQSVLNHHELLLAMTTGANRSLVEYLKNNTIDRGGTTLVATMIKNNQLDFVSVGDSRISLLRNGALTTINRAHTYGSELDEKAARGLISFEEAKLDPQRAALTSYIGMGELEYLDSNSESITLVPGDKVVLMSDGIFGFIDDYELLTVLQEYDIYEAAVELEQMILNRNHKYQDNFTAVIIEVQGV